MGGVMHEKPTSGPSRLGSVNPSASGRIYRSGARESHTSHKRNSQSAKPSCGSNFPNCHPRRAVHQGPSSLKRFPLGAGPAQAENDPALSTGGWRAGTAFVGGFKATDATRELM